MCDCPNTAICRVKWHLCYSPDGKVMRQAGNASQDWKRGKPALQHHSVGLVVSHATAQQGAAALNPRVAICLECCFIATHGFDAVALCWPVV